MEQFSLSLILAGLQTGLPVVVTHIAVAILILGAGIKVYIAITPTDEHKLISDGNSAASAVLAGAVLGQAVPLAATLATSKSLLDVVIWGAVAVLLQLALFAIASVVAKRMRAAIEAGNVAVGIMLAAGHVSVGLLVAGAMAG